MPLDEREDAALRDKGQHQEKCPSCLSRSTRLVPGVIPGEFFMGCDACGHTWVGKDFPADLQQEGRLPIPDTDPK
jgi:hypothetical protein